MKNMQFDDEKVRREECEDKGIDTFADGYSKTEQSTLKNN
jgi:hypothetical protein